MGIARMESVTTLLTCVVTAVVMKGGLPETTGSLHQLHEMTDDEMMTADGGMMTGTGGVKRSLVRSGGDHGHMRIVVEGTRKGSGRTKRMRNAVQKIGRSATKRSGRKRKSDAGMRRSCSAAVMKSDVARRLSGTRWMRQDGVSERMNAKWLRRGEKRRRQARRKRLNRNGRTTHRNRRSSRKRSKKMKRSEWKRRQHGARRMQRCCVNNKPHCLCSGSCRSFPMRTLTTSIL
mmetsp:Transcript_18982/g.37269  ORF Transcript_18982/g.37269 Transcript_18982/m.37269 type:complete len:233 (+) Transcript_18982:423-1121(+)